MAVRHDSRYIFRTLCCQKYKGERTIRTKLRTTSSFAMATTAWFLAFWALCLLGQSSTKHIHLFRRQTPKNNTILLFPASAYSSAACTGYGGTCQSYPSCSGISVSRVCPGPAAIRCCVHPPGTDVVDSHLNIEEGGLYLKG